MCIIHFSRFIGYILYLSGDGFYEQSIMCFLSKKYCFICTKNTFDCFSLFGMVIYIIYQNNRMCFYTILLHHWLKPYGKHFRCDEIIFHEK